MADQPASTMRLECAGVTQDDIKRISDAIGSEPDSQKEAEGSRTGGELLTAAFILGVLNATPPLIKAIADILSDIRKSRYFTVKLTRDNGQTVVEGPATPDRLVQIARSLEDLKAQQATPPQQGITPP